MRTRVAALIAVIVVIVLTGQILLPASAPAQVTTIRLQYIIPAEQLISLFDVPQIQQSVLKNYGKRYKMELMRSQGSPLVIAAMAAGEVDVGGGLAYNSFASAILKGVVPGGLTVISSDFYDSHPDYFNFTWLASADAPINSVQDLRGKKIGVLAIGTGVDATTWLMLKKNGLDPVRDVNIVEIPAPAMQEAVKSKKIDAGVFPSIFYYRAMATGGFKKVFDSYQAWGKPYLFAFAAARTDFLKKSPDAMRAFLEDYVGLLRHVYRPENRDAVIDAVAAQFKLPKPVLQQYYLTKKDVYRPLDGRASAEDLQHAVTRFHELGFLERDVEVARYIDNSYLPR